ncbi:MAG: PilN domain-containing protein [Fimbriimonadales bacterium]
MAKPDITAASTSAVATQLETPHGVNYIGAIGLAMDGIGAGSPNVPTFDLASRNGRGHELRAARKSLMTSMVAALVVTAIGGMGAAFLGTRMSKVNAGLEKTKAEHAALQARYRPESDARLARVNQLRDLSNEGIPFQPLMDAVSAALDPQAGLTTIRFEQGGGIKISGEATSELALINTMERMRQFPHFTNTIVDSFDKGGPNAKELGLRFSISTRYAGTFGNVPAALKPPQTELRTP